jgi:CRP/FNR family transcriptional regulator
MLTECKCEGCELKTLFFENFNTKEIEAVCSYKIEKNYKKGEIIIKQGEPIEDFIYLKSGLVKLFKTNSLEQDQIICFAAPLDFVSLLSVFSNTTYQYSVTAIEDSTACSMQLSKINKTINENGHFARSIIEKMSETTDKILRTTLEIRQRRLYGRVAYMLLYFADEIYKSNEFELPVSRKEIAEFIGMTLENVIRTLSELRKDNILKIYGKEILITDRAKLEKLRDFS